MDDEEMIRDVLCQMLVSLGYDPYPTLDGADAIDAYVSEMEAGRAFDLAIMDLTIPGGMGGREAAQRLKAAYPEARLIVSSGYSDSRVMAEHQEYGFCGMIAKPYRISDLKTVLENALEENA